MTFSKKLFIANCIILGQKVFSESHYVINTSRRSYTRNTVQVHFFQPKSNVCLTNRSWHSFQKTTRFWSRFLRVVWKVTICGPQVKGHHSSRALVVSGIVWTVQQFPDRLMAAPLSPATDKNCKKKFLMSQKYFCLEQCHNEWSNESFCKSIKSKRIKKY